MVWFGLHHDMCHDEAHAAAGADADEARNHEAVVQDVLADARRARAVKTDAREVRRVRRQEEVAVARRDERHDEHRVHADRERHRDDDGNRRGLRVHELRRQERDDGVCPRIRRNGRAERLLEERHVCAEIRVSHPGDAIDRDERDDAGFEDLAVADIFCLDFARQENQCADEQHDHLDDGRHGNGFRLRALFGDEMRQEVREIAENGDDGDAAEEDEHRAVELLREVLALQRLRVTIDILLVFRVLDEFLEARVLVEVLAAAVAPERGADDAEARGRDGDGENLEDGVVIARRRHEADDRDDCDRDRRRADAHLRRDGRNRHRALRTDALLDGDVVNDREHRVDDMARAAEDGQEPRRQRRENRDLLRIAAQERFRVLQHDRQAARRLEEACAGDDREDGEHDVDWRRARLVTKNERENDEADAADDGEADAPVAHADKQARQEHEETE